MKILPILFGLLVSLAACGEVVLPPGHDAASATGSGGTATTSSVSTTGTGGEGGAGAGGCTPVLHVTTVENYSATVPEGAIGAHMVKVALAATCADITVYSMLFQLRTPDASYEDLAPFCQAPCSTADAWNFRFPRLEEGGSGVIALGQFLDGVALNNPAQLFFKISPAFTVYAEGQPRMVTVVLDVAKPLPSPNAYGKRFFALPVHPESTAKVSWIDDTTADKGYVTIQ